MTKKQMAKEFAKDMKIKDDEINRLKRQLEVKINCDNAELKGRLNALQRKYDALNEAYIVVTAKLAKRLK